MLASNFTNNKLLRKHFNSYFSDMLYPFLQISDAATRRCFIKKGVTKNFAKFTGKHLCQSLFFNKVAGVRTATLLKKRLWFRCFPVNLAKFLRTPFLQNTSGRLLLKYRQHLLSQTYRWLLLYLSLTNLTAAQMCQCAKSKINLRII